jgi:hypothetical protein
MAKYRDFPAKFRLCKWQYDCYRRNLAQIGGRNESEQLNPRTWLRLTVSGDLPDEQRDQCCRLPVGPPPEAKYFAKKKWRNLYLFHEISANLQEDLFRRDMDRIV